MKVKISKKEIHALSAVVLAGVDNIITNNFEYEDCSNRKFKGYIKELQPLLERLKKKNSEPQSETIRCTRTETKISGIEGLPEGIRRELLTHCNKASAKADKPKRKPNLKKQHNKIVHQWYAVSRRVGIPQAQEEPEQTFESVRTTGLLSTVAARNNKHLSDRVRQL